jgi:ribonuclease D
MTDYIYVDSDDALYDMVDDYADATVIGIDTEFARFNTYYPILGLMQLSDGEQCHLIDPLNVGDWTPVMDLFEDRRVTKLLHACSEDLEVFTHRFGLLPEPLFDTQVAAAVCGQGFSLGYQALVEKNLEIHVPKEETRSDWLARPLSDAQLTYAALDVLHLPDIYALQQAQLASSGREQWVTEECDVLVGASSIGVAPDATYLRVKNAWKLSALEQTVLRELCAYRERTARSHDVPRSWIASDSVLAAMSRTDGLDHSGLAELGVRPRELRRYGDALIDCAAAARRVPTDEWAEPLERPTPPDSGPLMKVLKQVVDGQADHLNVAPELLARKRHLEALLRSGAQGDYELPEALAGWRREVIGDHLLAALT